jgi:N-acetylmuramoyl-L-alanine amidase
VSTVYIHQGHSRVDSGAVAADGYKESDYTKSVGEKLATKLKEVGHTVYLGRERLPDAKSPEVAADANQVGADLVVSIHANSADSTEARGTEVFITKLSKKAEDIATAVKEIFQANHPDRKWRGVKPDSESAAGRLAILRNTKAPALLIEGGFLSNAGESTWLKSVDGQNAIVDVLFSAIARHV